jgi:hypothetical protein
MIDWESSAKGAQKQVARLTEEIKHRDIEIQALKLLLRASGYGSWRQHKHYAVKTW